MTENASSTGGNTKRAHEDSVDGGNAKRARGNFERIEMRLLIPFNTAGAIIGKGGSNIRELRQEFNANIQLPDSQGIERIISATTKTVKDAANLAGRVMGALSERMQRREKDGVIKLLVHKSQAGTIIGLKGSRIKELRETTGANIKVNQECCPDSTDRICQMKGPTETVIKCLDTILELLQDAPPKGPIHNYNPNFWDDSYDYGGYNKYDRDAPQIDRDRRGGFNRGRGGGRRFGDGDNYGGGGGGYGGGGRDPSSYGGGNRNSRSGISGIGGGRNAYGGYDEDGYDDYGEDYNNYNQGYDDQGGLQDRFAEDEQHGDYVVKQVTIPTELAGSIIGKGGARIRQIRQDCGAMIKIDEAEPGSNERIITITGTQEETQNAQYLLQKSVKMYSGEY